MILVVGGTGFLGEKICRCLRAENHGTRALVRSTSNTAKVDVLRSLGVEIRLGDLKDAASIDAALLGVRTVISTATATVSRAEGDSIETVDLRGQLQLLNAAKRAGVEQYVFVSFYPQPIEFPLQVAKRTVERAIVASGLPYTILQPTDFMEVWLGPAVGFHPAAGSIRIFGDGTKPTSWISADDVAAFAAAAIGNPGATNRILPLGGAPLSALEAAEAFRAAGATIESVEKIPEAALEAQWKDAKDPLARSLAALTLSTARGAVADAEEALAAMPRKLKTVREYAIELLSARHEK